MLTFFNRRELTITFSMAEQVKLRDILESHSIRYQLKVVNRDSPSFFSEERARLGTFGEDLYYNSEYIFYVHKNDWDEAQAVIAGLGR